MDQVKLAPNSILRYKDKRVLFMRAISLDQALVKVLDEDSHEFIVAVADLRPVSRESGDGALPKRVESSCDLATISKVDFEALQQKMAILGPLIPENKCGRKAAVEAARRLQCHSSTVYDMVRKLRSSNGDPTVLLPAKRGPATGKSYFDPRIESVMDDVIKTYHLTTRRPTVSRTYVELRRRLRRAGIPRADLPCEDTLRRRIKGIGERTKMAKRISRKAADDKLAPRTGRSPPTSAPFESVQIDHTLVDLDNVDSEDREPIGRAWLTLAIDIHTRVVPAWYLSFDHPNATAVGLVIAMMMCPKEPYLEYLGVDAKIPIYGKCKTVHWDNAKEFKSQAVRRGCIQHNIEPVFRPLGKAHFGGHIERLIGHYMGDVHLLPGTTRSNVQELGEDDGEASACMTLTEFEKWFAYNVARYHELGHAGLGGLPPIQAYEQALLDSRSGPRGLPPRPVDPDRVLVDFLPVFTRAVRRTGICIERIRYWSDYLSPLVADPPERHVFRRDPRDISRLKCIDPQTGEVIEIPYADLTRPPISLHQLRMSRARAKALHQPANEDTIFQYLDKQDEIVEGAAKLTKAKRRERERNQRNRAASERGKSPAPDDNTCRRQSGEREKTRFPNVRV